MKELAVIFVLVTTLAGFPYEDEYIEFGPSNCTELHVYYEHDYGYFEVPQIPGGILAADYTNENVTSNTSASIRAGSYGEEEFVPAWIAGRRYNWWQILLQTGGKPGTLKEVKKWSDTNTYYDYCERPLRIEGEKIDAYHYEKSDFKTVYRNETARVAFQGTPDEFLDVFGFLVWTPPPDTNDTRVYHIRYSLDDVGFWVQVEPELCEFNPSKPSLRCVAEADRILPDNLLASLLGHT